MAPRRTLGRQPDGVQKPAAALGRIPASSNGEIEIQRPERQPADQLSLILGSAVTRYPVIVPETGGGTGSLKKLLINVTIQRSLGPVQVVMSPENTVEDLIKAAADVYVKERMRPLLAETDPRCFELHYSQFSLESLNRNRKLKDTRSRNFFLCMKPMDNIKSSRLHQEQKLARWPSTLTKFMDYLL